ncbi:MAG: hypothetical protein ACQESE_04655 [Nanobdellota archaeon]
MKKIMFSFLIIVTLLVAVGCSSNPEGNQITGHDAEVASAPSAKEIASMSTEERFIAFQAEFTCKLIGIKDQDAMMEAINSAQDMMTRYQLNAEEVQSLSQGVHSDVELQMAVFEEMEHQCPVKMAENNMTSDVFTQMTG